MSTKLQKKVINGIAPITLAECVMLGDGTNVNLKQKLETLSGNGASSGTSNSVEGGNVFFEKTDTRTITYSSGNLLINGKLYGITEGSVTAKDYTEWNPGNPNYTCYFVYNVISNSFAFRGAYKTEPTLINGDFIIFISYSDSSNSYFKTFNYDNRYIRQKQNPYEKVIKRLTVIGDSLTAVGKWHEVADTFDTKLKILNKNIQAVSGATLYSQGLGYASSVSVGDVVVLFMGTNDCLKDVTLGTVQDEPTTDSFCGRWKKIIETIYDKSGGNTVILVVGGSPLNGYSGGETYEKKYRDDVEKYDDAQRELCKLYSIPYLSLLENIGINHYNYSSTQIDGCHYTPDMYKRLGNLIYEELYRVL